MEKEFTFLWSLWIDCSQFMEDQDEPKCQYGLSFFVGLLYLNQNFTCLGNNLEFNMHGNGHYNHLQNGCETFIIQTMTTILTWLIEFQDDMEWSFRIGINFRYFSFFPCYWIVGVIVTMLHLFNLFAWEAKNSLWLWKYWGYHSTCENVHPYTWVLMF
jgi:hypothetical protein